MSRKAAIVQSNYIPWKGYFDLIRQVDEFILYDDVQYTRRDWRNRNLIKTPQGLQWLTIPVEVKGKYFQTIRETRIADPAWVERHWNSLLHNYGRALCLEAYRATLEELYLGCTESLLSLVNHRFLTTLCRLLGIGTRISWSSDYRLVPGKTERLVELCTQVGADEYISGPSARCYIASELFAEANVRLTWMDYEGYPEYPQLFGPFEHGVSVLDLLLNCGPDAPKYLDRKCHGSVDATDAQLQRRLSA
jgi:hypothetical protein